MATATFVLATSTDTAAVAGQILDTADAAPALPADRNGAALLASLRGVIAATLDGLTETETARIGADLRDIVLGYERDTTDRDGYLLAYVAGDAAFARLGSDLSHTGI